MNRKLILTAVSAALLVSSPVVQSITAAAEIRFVVLGHIRGDREGGLNPRQGELLDEVRPLSKNLLC
jgi:hypothetical protein